MSKSGEILRISHGNYSFLCSHCGFNFNDINEILVHIDFHFDISDSKITTPADTTDISHATGSLLCDDTDGDCTNYSVQKLCIEQIFNSENVRTEFKIEYDREGKTDELPLDDEVLEKTERLDVPSKINRHKTSGTKRRNVTKKLNTTNDDNQDNDSRSYPIGESDSNGSSDWKPHLGDPHQMLDKTFECYICGYFCKTFAALKRHLGGSVHSKSNCYQCESQPVVHNELHPRPHKCCLCGTWFENHLHFRKHFKNSHGKDVEKFFAKRSNCNEYSCYICKKGKSNERHSMFRYWLTFHFCEFQRLLAQILPEKPHDHPQRTESVHMRCVW